MNIVKILDKNMFTIMFEGNKEEKEERSYRCCGIYLMTVKLTPYLTVCTWLLVKELVGFHSVDYTDGHIS